jgi:hypothetical protein
MEFKQKIELTLLNGGDVDHYPERVELTFDDALIRRIALARTMLSLDLLGAGSDITVALDDNGRFLLDDDDWQEMEYVEDRNSPSFQVSRGWLAIEPVALRLTYWERHLDDELNGTMDLSEASFELREAIEKAMPAAYAELRQQFSAR